MDIRHLRKVTDCIIEDLTEENDFAIYGYDGYDNLGFILAAAKLAKIDNTFAEKIVKLFNQEAGLQDYDDIQNQSHKERDYINMIKPFKIKVESEEHSREIQEYLFNHKVPWYSSGYEVGHTDKPFLFVYPDYGGWKPNISYTRYEESFNDSQLPEEWFYDGKLQSRPPKSTLLEELHSILDKYEISISLAQDCVNSYIMLLESGSDETLGVYFEDKVDSETIQEYIDACIIRGLEFEQSRLFEPHIVNYLGKDIPVPYTFKEGWLATDEGGEIYVYKHEPEISYLFNIFNNSSTDTVSGIDYVYLGKMNFNGPYKNWRESKLFFDLSEDKVEPRSLTRSYF